MTLKSGTGAVPNNHVWLLMLVCGTGLLLAILYPGQTRSAANSAMTRGSVTQTRKHAEPWLTYNNNNNMADLSQHLFLT